jgi:hypothetical protein
MFCTEDMRRIHSIHYELIAIGFHGTTRHTVRQIDFRVRALLIQFM